jgi:CRP-like cAMP-binding protein
MRSLDLKPYDVFAELDLTELGLLARIATTTHAGEGEVLIQAGLPARTLYLLQEGDLMVAFPDGRAITLHTAGEVVGWSALIHPSSYTASVVCLTDATLIAFAGRELLRLVQSNAATGTRIMRKVSAVVSKRLPFIPEQDKRKLKYVRS